MKYFKIFIVFLTLLISMLFLSINTKALSFKQDIKEEVAEYVNEGKLPEFHKIYVDMAAYQTLYTKMVRTYPDGLTYFASLTEQELKNAISHYFTRSNSIWDDILNNLDIEPKYLEPNKILGLYFDILNEETCYLYLIWTSEYIPTDLMAITELTVNNKTYYQYPKNETPSYDNQNWWDSDFYHLDNYNLSLFLTPIAGYERGVQFGIPLTQTYTFKRFKAGLSDVAYGYEPDSVGLYDVTVEHEITFDLGKIPTKNGQKLCQLVTHAYEIIQDCEVQSYFDITFGGYIHQVAFNTTISIDKIYRVDVAYKLSSENKSWYQFWLNTKEVEIKKSLNATRVSGGIFNLFTYQGFKEGTFQSNVKDSKTYKYKLHLNYDDDSWNLFNVKSYYESDYKVIKDFQILRMNFLKDDKVYDVAIKMDTVDGETLSIVDRDLILDTSSTTWQIKDKIYDTYDTLVEKIGKTGTIIATIATAIITILFGYLIYKLIKLIITLLKRRS